MATEDLWDDKKKKRKARDKIRKTMQKSIKHLK